MQHSSQLALFSDRVIRIARVVKDYLFDWLGIDFYTFFGPYPILVFLYILNIIDLFYHEIGKVMTNEPAITYFISVPFVLTAFLPMVFRLRVKWPEIKECYKRKTALTRSLGLVSFLSVEFASVSLGLIFGLWEFFQQYISDLGIRLQLILYGLTVPNLLSIIARGYIGQSLIARKLALPERIQRHLHAVVVLVGAGFLIAGLVFYFLPAINEKQGPLLAEDFAYARPSFINSTRHEITLISTLPNNRIIVTEQFVYAKPGKYLFVYVFPYHIKPIMRDPLQLNNNRIIELEYENFIQTQSSLVWIIWNSTSVGSIAQIGGFEQGFEIDGATYESNKGHYSIVLPLAANPKRLDPKHDIGNMLRDYQSSWIWDPLKLHLVIDGDATDRVYNPPIEKEGLYHKYQVPGNNWEPLWTIPSEQTVSSRYTILDEVRDYERSVFFSGIFLGIGIPALIGSIVDYVKWRRSELIRYSGMMRVKQYLFHGCFTLFEVALSYQEKLNAPLAAQKTFARQLYTDKKGLIEKLIERADNELIVIQPLLDPNLKPLITFYMDMIDHLLKDFPKAVEEGRAEGWITTVNNLRENVERFMEEPT